MKIHPFDLIFSLLVKRFIGDDGFQNMFIYQPTFSTLELKKGKYSKYVIGGNLKVCLNLNFFHSMALSYVT